MIAALISLCARNRLLVVMLSVVACVVAGFCLKELPMDAIPDLSDTQVIVYSRWEQSPDRIEDQVTYPIITSLLGAPKAKKRSAAFPTSVIPMCTYCLKTVRTSTGPDRGCWNIYQNKSQATQRCEDRASPDATGVGWVFQYALVDESGQTPREELRSYQDWFLRFAIQSVPGVAEVATVGGAIKQYQVTVDPNRLSAFGLSLSEVATALRKSNSEVGGRLVEISGKEFMVRGRGYVRSIEDLNRWCCAQMTWERRCGSQTLVGCSLGRSCAAESQTRRERRSRWRHCAVMRMGENALSVIARVKERLSQLESSLPKGVRIVTTHDRSELIRERWPRSSMI